MGSTEARNLSTDLRSTGGHARRLISGDEEPLNPACSPVWATSPGEAHGTTTEHIGTINWLTDVLERMVSSRTKAHELEQLLPWACQAERLAATDNA